MIQTTNPMSLLRLYIFFFILDQCTCLLVSSGRIKAATAEISHGLLQNETWYEAAKRIIWSLEAADTAYCLQSYCLQPGFLSSPPPTTEFSVHPIIGLSIQDGRRDPPSPSPPLSWDLVVPSGFPLDFWSIQVDPSSKLKFLSPQCEISISPTQIKKFRKLISWYETYQSNNETICPCAPFFPAKEDTFSKKPPPYCQKSYEAPCTIM